MNPTTPLTPKVQQAYDLVCSMTPKERNELVNAIREKISEKDEKGKHHGMRGMSGGLTLIIQT